MVPMTAALPAPVCSASRLCQLATSNAVVLLPLVPVMPISCSALAGSPKKRPARALSLTGRSRTPMQGIASTGGSKAPSSSNSTALAPRAAACSMNCLPSV